MAKLVDLGGAPVNQSERETIELLVRDLPKAWSVIPNASVPDQRTGHAYEYDAIVVASYAVYVVEVKGWRGTIRQLGQADWQLEGGQIERNPLPLADLKAKVLASLLKKVPLQGRRPPYVHACLVCGSDESVFEVYGPDARRCLRPSEIVPYLRDPTNLPFSKPDSYQPIHDKLVKAVVGMLEPRMQTGRRYGSYAATSLQERDEERAIWLGRHALLDDDRVVQIRAWYLSAYRYTEEERARERSRLKRAAEALAKVGNHPRIARLRDFGEKDGEFYEVTDWTDTGTLATAFVRGALGRLSPARQLDIIGDVADALEAARGHGVFHRAISPQSVLLDADGHAKLTGFDLAFMEGSTGSTVFGREAHPHAEFLPPELRDSANYEVFHNSDLYSLAKMSKLLFPDGFDADIQALIDQCLAEDSSERPATPGEFLLKLDALRGGAEPATASLGAELEPGDVVDGVNTVLGRIGRGAGAMVYRVANEPLGCELALKLIVNPPEGYDPSAEFKLLRVIESPHVPRAHWLGRIMRSDGPPLAYLLLDLVEGRRLSDIIQTGPIDPELALDLADDILDALEALHGAGTNGVLHRDVKAANIIVGPAGAMLVDFGTARETTEAGSAPEGTLRVTPPDLSSTGWEPQADVFSAACVIYEMLAGQPPWPSVPSPNTQPKPLDALELDAGPLPDTVARVLEQALLPAAADRFPDAASLRSALAEARASDGAESDAVEEDSATRTSDTETTIASLIESSGRSMWTPGRVQALTGHPDLAVPLAHALLDCVLSPVDSTAEAARHALLGSEARATGFEAPMAEAMPRAYDALADGLRPAAWDGAAEDESGAAQLTAAEGDTGLHVDALHFTEWKTLTDAAVTLNCKVSRWAWAAPIREDSQDAIWKTAFEVVPASVRSVALPPGDRAAVELGQLVVDRHAALETALLEAIGDTAAGSAVWVVAATGLVYLGHGLRRDVGEGLGDRADTARATWAAAFAKGRFARTSVSLPSRLRQPTRELDGWRYPVGRLAWPDAPVTPWLQSGGLSLPERVLALFRIEREVTRG